MYLRVELVIHNFPLYDNVLGHPFDVDMSATRSLKVVQKTLD